MRVRHRQHLNLTRDGSLHKLTSPDRRDAAALGDSHRDDATLMTAPAPLQLVRAGDLQEQILAELDRAIDQAPAPNAPFVPTWDRPNPEMFGRGVYALPYRDTLGNPLVVAIRSDGRFAGWLPLMPHQAYQEVADELWYVLDGVDPVAELEP